jgi:hypothetical protein
VPNRVILVTVVMCLLLLGAVAWLQIRSPQVVAGVGSAERAPTHGTGPAVSTAADEAKPSSLDEEPILITETVPNPAETPSWTFPVAWKVNSEDPTKTDVYRVDAKTKQQQFLVTLSDVCRHQFIGEQHQSGDVYMIRTTGSKTRVTSTGECAGWGEDSRRELWKYDASGKGLSIATRVDNFQVSQDGKLLALSNLPESGDLTIMAADTTVLKVISHADVGIEDPEVFAVTTGAFWVRETVGAETKLIVRVRVPSFEVDHIDLSDLGIGPEFELEPEGNRFVFSNYPDMYDVDTGQEFIQSKAKVNLAVYDLQTKKTVVIARSITKPFQPKWVGKDLIQFDDPGGKRRITKRLP